MKLPIFDGTAALDYGDEIVKKSILSAVIIITVAVSCVGFILFLLVKKRNK